jgi:hypothetical protein
MVMSSKLLNNTQNSPIKSKWWGALNFRTKELFKTFSSPAKSEKLFHRLNIENINVCMHYRNCVWCYVCRVKKCLSTPKRRRLQFYSATISFIMFIDSTIFFPPLVCDAEKMCKHRDFTRELSSRPHKNSPLFVGGN